MVDLNKGATVELVKALSDDIRRKTDNTMAASAGTAVREQITELSDYVNSQVRIDTINGKPVLIIPEGRNENGD